MRNRGPLARGLLLVPCLALLLGGPSPALATEYGALRKAGRGLAAIGTCFLEIPGNMVEATREKGWVRGLPLGFVKGLGGLVVRPLVGAYELLSAPIAAPRGFVPLIQPEFPWGYFEDPPPPR